MFWGCNRLRQHETDEHINPVGTWSLWSIESYWCFGDQTSSSSVCLVWHFKGSSQFMWGSLLLEHSIIIHDTVCVCVCVCVGHTPAGLEMVTTRPLDWRNSGRKLLVMLNVPKKFTSMQPRKFDISDSSASPKFTHTPALFTKPHRPTTHTQ